MIQCCKSLQIPVLVGEPGNEATMLVGEPGNEATVLAHSERYVQVVTPWIPASNTTCRTAVSEQVL